MRGIGNMSLLNYDDVERQLVLAGLILKGPLEIGTAKPVRCRVEGADKEHRGWYRLYEMPLDSGDTLLVGSYGVWRGNDNGATKIELPRVDRARLTTQQLDALKARMRSDREAAAAELARQHERASERATRWWAQCSCEAASNAYLTRKGLPPGRLYGARLSKAGNLVIPIGDAKFKVWGLQVIYSDPKVKAKKGRDRDYSPAGLGKQGHWHMIGLAGRGSVVLVCEGFATGASLHEATSLPVAVAFDAGNLIHVAKALAQAYKGARILVCADDDWLQKCRVCNELTRVDVPDCTHCGKPHECLNPGIAAASAAALAVNGHWVAPAFPTQRPTDRKGPTDFNDLHVAPDGGLPLVSRQIEAAIASQGWRLPARGAAAAPPTLGGGGGGDGRRQAVAVMSLDDLVERFIPLDDGTGDTLFDTWSNRMVRIKQAVALLAAGVRWDDVKRHPMWIERGAYYLDQVGFDPAGTDEAVLLNTWQGWPRKPKQGSCQRILDLLRYLCGEDNGDEVYWWLLRWMAYPLQHPGAKLSSAVIMHGPQGTGKSTVFQVLAQIYDRYATVLNQRGLEDRFNADWVDGKLFLLAEEVVTKAEMWHIKDELKELVTGEWVRVNGKFVGAFRQRNRINIVYLSNYGQPLPIENDDRRHLVVWTPPQREDRYYDAVRAEIADGGIDAFYHHLLNLDLEDFKPWERPPMTEAKKELIEVSKSSEERFLDAWVGMELGLPVSPCKSQDLYTAYARWCRLNGERNQRPSNQFFNVITRLPGWSKRKARVSTPASSTTLPIVFPSAAILERAGTAQPATESTPDWLQSKCDVFTESLKTFGHSS